MNSSHTYIQVTLKFLLNDIIMELKQFFDKVRHDFNNSAEAWNKGLTVDYTILQWTKAISHINGKLQTLYLMMKCVVCKLKEEVDTETEYVNLSI